MVVVLTLDVAVALALLVALVHRQVLLVLFPPTAPGCQIQAAEIIQAPPA